MNLFAYGTLMLPEIFANVSGVEREPEPAKLSDYARYAIKNEYYPAMIELQGQRVSGVIYRDLSGTAIRRLDSFEGEQYQRVEVSVDLTCGQQVLAQTYLFRPRYHSLLLEKEWSFEHFVAKRKKDFEKEYKGWNALV